LIFKEKLLRKAPKGLGLTGAAEGAREWGSRCTTAKRPASGIEAERRRRFATLFTRAWRRRGDAG